MRFLSYFFSLLVVMLVSACGGGGGSPGLSSTNTPTALFSTAPAALTLPAGSNVTYPVSGGTPPYAVVADSVGIVSANLNDSVLGISAIAVGSSSVIVSDAKGNKITVSVTVPTTPLFTPPSAVTVPIGVTTVAYAITGGTLPYVALTSNPGVMTTTLGADGKSFTITGVAGGSAQVGISDAKGALVTVSVTVPDVPLATTAPPSITLNPGASISYPVSGGVLPYSVVTDSFGFVNASINQSVLNLSAVSGGTVKVTIADSKGSKLDVVVTVPLPASLKTTAQSSITLASGLVSTYSVYGGTPPYKATSNNESVVLTSVSGSTGQFLDIRAVAAGAAAVEVRDAAGGVVTIAVTVPAPASLFTTAPSTLTLAIGASSEYLITGGTAPYVAISNNVSFVGAGVSGAKLTISALAGGSALVIVSDAKGATLNIAVTVPTVPLTSTAPSSITIAANNVPNYFSLSGGTPPYVARSNNELVATASVQVGTSGLAIAGVSSGAATIVVTDAKGAALNIQVNVPAPGTLFTTAPSSISLAVGSNASFNISGGSPPYVASSSETSSVQAFASSGLLSITATSAGKSTVVVTDSKGVTLSISVIAGSSSAFVVNAPAAVTMTANTVSFAYPISGGTAPYTASSSDSRIATAIVRGNSVTISAGSVGVATLAVFDSLGASKNISVTVEAGLSGGALFTTAPSAFQMSIGGSEAFTIVGGTPPYSVKSTDTNAARVVFDGSNGFAISAFAFGTPSVIVTDSKGVSVSISVTIGSSAALFVNAPATLAVGAGQVLPPDYLVTGGYAITGGTAPYTVSSSDSRIATGTISGAKLTINGIKSGFATLTVFDSAGAAQTINVTVDGNSGTGAATIIDIFASSSTLASAPGSKVTFIVNVKDGLNTAVPKETVTFSASNGGTLFGANPSPITDANGTIATVSLSPGSDATNRSIVVTAAIGTVNKTITIPVTGTTLTLSGVGSALAGTAATPFAVKALDSGGKPIAGATLSISSTTGNGVSPTTVVTDVAGSATVNFSPTVAGTDTVKVTGLGTSAQTTVVVSNEDFSFISPAANDKLVVNSPSAVTACYKVGGVGVAGQTVTFSTTRGTLGAATAATVGVTVPQTIPVGCATTTISSSTAGPVTVSAQLAAPSTARTSSSASFVATVPSRIDLQANPGSLAPNAAGATTNQSALTATVRDATGNPVSGVTVNFTATSDLSNGTISPGSTTTDANGIATVQFIPGALSTSTNGVVLKATLPAFPSVTSATANLTVSGQSLFISIGVASDIVILDTTTYQKNFTAYLTDASGAPSANRTVTLSVLPTQYGKGFLVYDTINKVWTYSATSPTRCGNEDLNNDGILDAGEDTNGNGRLTPGLPVVVSPATVTTDASGYAKFSLLYGKNFAWWLDSQITARASVGGTESKQLNNYSLELDAATAKSEGSPPNQTSPFGTATVCTNPN
jgi:hypothetical protein